MKDMTFEELLEINCFSDNDAERMQAGELLEHRYCCEIHCANMDNQLLQRV